MSKAAKKVKEAAIENDDADASTEAKAKGSRKIMLEVDGESIARTDFIRREWKAGKSRGAIAKELTKLQGKAVPYQIVFAATKGVEGGPAKEAKEETASEE